MGAGSNTYFTSSYSFLDMLKRKMGKKERKRKISSIYLLIAFLVSLGLLYGEHENKYIEYKNKTTNLIVFVNKCSVLTYVVEIKIQINLSTFRD